MDCLQGKKEVSEKSMRTQATCLRFYWVPGHEGSSGGIKVRVVNSNL